MPTSGTFLMMDRNPRECVIASIRCRWSWRKTKKRAGWEQPGRFFRLLILHSEGKEELSRWAGTPHQGGYRIVRPFPRAKQQYLGAAGIFEHVVDVRKAFHFIKAGPARIWARRRARDEKLTQFGNLFLRMVAQIFDEGRLFGDVYHHYASPPHSGYVLLTSKDAETGKMFHDRQQIFQTNRPAGFIVPGAENTVLKRLAHEYTVSAAKSSLRPPLRRAFPPGLTQSWNYKGRRRPHNLARGPQS